MPAIAGPTRRIPCQCGSGHGVRTIHDRRGRFLALGCEACELEMRVLYEREGERPTPKPWWLRDPPVDPGS